MLRTVSPSPPLVVSPAASMASSTSGSFSSFTQCSWMPCRVVSSASSRPYCLAMRARASSCAGVTSPPATLIRTMNVPIFGLSWASAHQ